MMVKKNSSTLSEINDVIRENTKYAHELRLQKEEYYNITVIISIVFVSILLLGGIIATSHNLSKVVKMNASIYCTSGDVDFNFDNSTNVFNITGVDGLQCKGSLSGEMSLLSALLIGGVNGN